MHKHESARRLTIFIGESDRYHHHTLSAEIVQRAQRAGLAGCSVFRGVEGFGASRTLHTAHVLSLSEDLPIAVIIVDTAEHIDAFVPQLDELIDEGLVIVDDVEVLRYVGRED
jgi:PII-like signaling protein